MTTLYPNLDRDLVVRIIDRIITHQAQFDMDIVIGTTTNDDLNNYIWMHGAAAALSIAFPTDTTPLIEDCGTTACLAGWAMLLSPRELCDEHTSWSQLGLELLGLDQATDSDGLGDYNDISAIFYAESWPAWYADQITVDGDSDLMALRVPWWPAQPQRADVQGAALLLELMWAGVNPYTLDWRDIVEHFAHRGATR